MYYVTVCLGINIICHVFMHSFIEYMCAYAERYIFTIRFHAVLFNQFQFLQHL